MLGLFALNIIKIPCTKAFAKLLYKAKKFLYAGSFCVENNKILTQKLLPSFSRKAGKAGKAGEKAGEKKCIYTLETEKVSGATK